MRRALPTVIIIALAAAAVWYFTAGIDTPEVDPSRGADTTQNDQSDLVRTTPEHSTAESGSTDAKSAVDPPADPKPDVVADSATTPAPGDDSPADTIAAGDGVIAEAKRVDEAPAGPALPPDSTSAEEQSLAQAPEGDLTQGPGTSGDDSPNTGDESLPLAAGPTGEEPNAGAIGPVEAEQLASATTETPEQEPADGVADVVAGIGSETPPVVESPTLPPPQPIPAGRGDQTVTPERVVSVIPDDSVGRARIRTPDGDDGSGAVAPATGPVGEEQLASATTETPGQEPAAAVADVVAGIESPTLPPPQPIPADRGDQTVTPERVVSVIPDDSVERVRIRTPDGDDASGAEVLGTGPVEGEQIASATTATPGQEPAVAVADVVAGIGSETPPVVESPTLPPLQPIPAGQGDQAVTPERVVSVIPDDSVERVRIRKPDGDDASGAEVPATGPVEEEQLAAATTATPEQEPAAAAADVVAGVGSGTRPVVESPTPPTPQPIPAGRGDQTVTPERVVSVIPDDSVERVRIRKPDDDASGAEVPATGPVEEEQLAAATTATPEQEPAAAAADVVAGIGSGTPLVVESPTLPPPQPIPAGRGDQAVTPERVVSVIPDDSVERVRIRKPDGDDASGAEVPGTDPVEEEQLASATTAIPRHEPAAAAADGDDASGAEVPGTGPVEEEQLASATTAIPEQEPVAAVADVVAGIGTETGPVVESPAQPPPQPVPAGRGDQSVTPEQVVSVVPDDTIERVRISEPDGDDASGADSTITDPAIAGDKESAATLADIGEKVADTLAGVAADLGTVVKQAVDSMTKSGTEPAPLPTPPDPAGDSVSGEPVPQPRPTDGAQHLASRGEVPSQPAGDRTGQDTIPELASDIRTEAERFVETLKEPVPQPIPADRADHFVNPEQVISLVPDDIIERVTVRDLAEDDAISDDSPITVIRETDQIETVTQERLIAESGGDVEKPIRVPLPSGDQVEQTTIGDILADPARRPGALIQVVRTVRHFEVTTLKELLDNEPTLDSLLRVIKQPYRIETATLADLLQKQMDEDPDSIFYLHTVLPTDDQGIWGIVHFGIIDNFARGVAIRRGERVELYTVRIPRDADERLDDNSSSFLGKLIDEKTKESYVYNFREHRVGRNPDRIYPGQELVIINFKSAELAAIYEHFASG